MSSNNNEVVYLDLNDPKMIMGQAQFYVGQLVEHQKFNYRGVIIDVDPVFMGTEKWYQEVAQSKPPKDAPWYRVLVHDSDDETYVAERNLSIAKSPVAIDHPLVDWYFSRFDGSKYHMQASVN